MDKRTICLLVIFLMSIFFYTCEEDRNNVQVTSDRRILPDSNQVVLEFIFEINQGVYQRTNFGEPPQLAIWIESADSQMIKTVWVSRRAAKNDWKGKIECPVALPYWESRAAAETDKFNMHSRRESKYDAVSGATPRAGRFSASIMVPKKSTWNYFVEVNASADYNEAFAYWSKKGLPDSQANGQPSLVYSGQIIADGSDHNIPGLIGRTEQRRAVNSLSNDLSGITTAIHLIENIEVRSRF
jgi:hypothetical protein